MLLRMTGPLDGVWLRLDRADQRLAFLNKQRTALLKRKGNRLIGKFDGDRPEYVFRVPGKNPPLAWGLAVGEFAYHLRAALDGMLWQLVIARGGTPGEWTQFPIFEDETNRHGKPNAKRVQTMTRGVLDGDLAFIEAIQPYQFGPNFARWLPLGMLAHLNNVDKHRYVHPAFAMAAMTPTKGRKIGYVYFQRDLQVLPWRLLDFPTGPISTVGMNVAGFTSPIIPSDGSVIRADPSRLEYSDWGSPDDPAEVLRVFDVRPARPGAKVEMQPGFLYDITFTDRERPISISDLFAMRGHVDRVIAYFRIAIERPDGSRQPAHGSRRAPPRSGA
jgi:hypothetical protein